MANVPVAILCPACGTMQGSVYVADTQPTTNQLPTLEWACYRCGLEWVE